MTSYEDIEEIFLETRDDLTNFLKNTKRNVSKSKTLQIMKG